MSTFGNVSTSEEVSDTIQVHRERTSDKISRVSREEKEVRPYGL